jgi:Domain of unknown function (DUF4331)
MRTKNKWITALGATALFAGAVQLQPQEVTAADHADAPATELAVAADIADVYAWHTARGTIVMVMTFAGLRAGGDDPVYDPDVLYTIHVDNTADPDEKQDFTDNDNDNESDIQIAVRFGQNNIDEWGVQFNGVPGADDTTFDGPVQTDLTNGTATVIAGDFEDPFFFDLDGFRATRDNLLDDADPLDVAFASVVGAGPVDFFAGLNVMAIIVEVDAPTVVDGNADNFVQIWATTGVL